MSYRKIYSKYVVQTVYQVIKRICCSGVLTRGLCLESTDAEGGAGRH